MFKELGPKNVKLFERFMIKLDKLGSLQNLLTNDVGGKRLMNFLMEIANYARVNMRSVKINKYLVSQVFYPTEVVVDNINNNFETAPNEVGEFQQNGHTGHSNF